MQPEHEQAVRELIRTSTRDVSSRSSHEVAPVIKEYERGATTMLNAYLSRDTDRSHLGAAGRCRQPACGRDR